MKLPRLLMLSLVFVLVFVTSAPAGWGWMPSLNPFKKRDSHPASIGNQDGGWEWPGLNRKPAVAPAQPRNSMWQRANSSTKNTWSKTKSALTPWKAKPQVEEELVITGSNSSFSRMANGNGKQPVKKAFWAWGNEEQERPQKASSVSDFIGGRRPE